MDRKSEPKADREAKEQAALTLLFEIHLTPDTTDLVIICSITALRAGEPSSLQGRHLSTKAFDLTLAHVDRSVNDALHRIA